MIKNPKRAIVLKMSFVTAGNILLQLGFAEKFIRVFYGIDSCYYAENRALYDTVSSITRDYSGDKQVVVDVRLPNRNPLVDD